MKLMHRSVRFLFTALGPLCLILLLAGCQGMGRTAFLDSQQAFAEGRVEDGLVTVQQAIKLEPNNAEYRSTYLLAREHAVAALLDQAAKAREAGRPADSERLVQRILAIDPDNSRARAAQAEAARDARHATLLRQAELAWAKGDSQEALARLRAILAENRRHRAASELLRQIDEKTARPGVDPKLTAALRKPITIEFRDTPVRQVFEVLARTSGLNFVFDRDVRSDLRATVFFRNTTVQDAITMILLTNQLEQRVMDSTSILVYPNTPAKAREYQPLQVRTFFLNNAEVKTAANTIRTIVKTRDLVIDEKQNMLIMRDTPEAVRLAERLLALQDLPEPEVMLEVEVLEVKRTRLLELGVRWPSQLTLTPLSTTGGTTLTLTDLRNITSATTGATINPFVINARKEDTFANLLANPRIRSKSREKARILVGDRVPNITTTATSTGFVSESVTYVDVGLKLEVEPTVSMDDEVSIKVAMEVSSIVNQIQTRSGSLAYQIGTRNANTVLRLRDGENQVLAGLINDQDRNTGNRVPALGDIPLLGRLFGSQLDDAQKTEIVLSITPRIIRNTPRPSLADSEFDAGTEASIRNRGLEGPAGGVPVSPPPTPTPTPATKPPPGIPPFGQAPPTPTPTPAGAAGGVAGSVIGAPIGGVAGTAVSGPTAFVASGSTGFTWQGPTQAAVNSSFTLTLSVQPDQAITSIPLSLGYDPKLIEISAITEGDFMRQGGAASSFASRIDTPSGRVFITATRGTSDGASAAGTVATLTIKALTGGQSANVQIVAVSPVGVGGRAVTTQNLPTYTLSITP